MHWVGALVLIAIVHGILQDSNQFTPIEDKLSEQPPENEQSWAHLVIFEPQLKIKLTHLSYQVTSFLDFAPYINGFNRVKKYIKDYWRDLQDPAYFERVKHISTSRGSSPLLDEQDDAAFQSSEYCQGLPFACSTHLKIDRYLLEIEYLFSLFATTYHKFLVAIDHIDFHPSNLATFANNTWMKRSICLDMMGIPHN